MYCDGILALGQGRVVANGTPAEVLTEPLIAEVYGVRASATKPVGPDDRLRIRLLSAVPSGPKGERQQAG